MKEQLRKILYGGVYRADPGSDWYKEQDKRLEDALALLQQEKEEVVGTSEEGEEDMAKKKGKKDKPESFIDKIIKKNFVEEK